MSKIKDIHSKHPLLSHIILIFLTGAAILWAVLLWLDHWTMHDSTAIVPEIRTKLQRGSLHTGRQQAHNRDFRLYIRPEQGPPAP